jgi:cysteine-rich repeat protein
MGSRAVVASVSVALGALAACVAPDTRPCGDLVCPGALVCAPSGDRCADPDQVAACVDRAPGAACQLDGIGEGQCRDGLCVVAGCGDGTIDPGEACDDGEANGPDAACTADCKRPTCGDGERQGDEACDDPAGNADDRACLPTCVPASCGDSRVWLGHEACDAGAANDDADACTQACTIATCGDGHTWSGVEACDDGNLVSGDGCRADCGKVEACGDGALDVGEACDDGNSNPADGCDACVRTTWTAEAIVGGDLDALALDVRLPQAVAVGVDGDVYVADTGSHRIRRIDRETGAASVIAGTGVAGDSGDGGPATSAQLRAPEGVAVDGLGRVYVADTGNHRVRVIAPETGRIQTIAGTGVAGDASSGVTATTGALDLPAGVDVDGLGQVYIADSENHRVRRVGLDGVMVTIAGTGSWGFSGDGGPATAAQLRVPVDVHVTPSGELYIADRENQRVRFVDTSGTISTVIGDGSPSFGGDGGPATAARVWNPSALALGPTGDLFIADQQNRRVRKIDAASGLVSTIAGTGAWAFSGDGGPATAAALAFPTGLALDAVGNLYIGDKNNSRIRRVDAATQIITTYAGSGGFNGAGAGDGHAATSVALIRPQDVAFDPAGNLLVVDGTRDRVRRVDAVTREITTIAGDGAHAFAGDGGPATAASLYGPVSVAVDTAGNIFIAEYVCRIRRVDAVTGIITTVAGNGNAGSGGDGGPAVSAQLGYLGAIRLDAAGNLFVADRNNHRVRRIDAATGVITLVAGTGVVGSGGDGGDATAAELSYPSALAFEPSGDLLIADTFNDRIRRVDLASGLIETAIVATGRPRGVAVDADGNIFFSPSDAHRVLRRAAVGGAISIVAGDPVGAYGTAGSVGDGGPASGARLAFPTALAFSAAGDLYITDYDNGRIRRVLGGTGRITTAVGPVRPAGLGPLATAVLPDPRALVVSPTMTLLAGGSSGEVLRLRPAEALLDAVAGRHPDPGVSDLAMFRDATFGTVGGVAFDAAAGDHGVIYLTETSASRLHAVTIVDPDDPETWTIAVLGAGAVGFVDGALATARFRAPTGLHLDEGTRTLYVADTGNHVIRAVDLDGAAVATVAGTPATLGDFGDGLAATEALLYAPTAVHLAPSGELFIADSGNHRVRRVDPAAGLISTVLGDGVAASSGEGAPAWAFPVNDPRGLATDAFGNLFVTSSTAVRLLPADAAGLVDGSGPVQTIYGAAPRDTFPAFATACLTGVAAVDAETVHATDACSGMLIELWRQPAPP